MKNKTIAIIGSRNYKYALEAMQKIDLSDVTLIISGGARGVDKDAEIFAKLNNIPCQVIRPINQSDKFSYLLRNVEIITKADKIYALWDGESKGTKFVIDYAKARNKEVIIYV